MKVYVISLARVIDRRMKICRRLDELTIPYEVFDAIDGPAMDAHDKRASIDRLRFWCAMGRNAFEGEIGCALSHYGVWRKGFAAVDAGPICVLEDDADIYDGFNAALREIEAKLDKAKPQVVLLSNHEGQFVFADGYVITRSAAEAIAVENSPIKRPFDHWWKWRDMGLVEVFRYDPPVVSQDIHQTTIGRAKALCQMGLAEKIWWKMKRLIGQMILALLPDRG